jgi:hypothetical protein
MAAWINTDAPGDGWGSRAEPARQRWRRRIDKPSTMQVLRRYRLKGRVGVHFVVFARYADWLGKNTN